MLGNLGILLKNLLGLCRDFVFEYEIGLFCCVMMVVFFLVYLYLLMCD